jgi:hypothetical protein
MTDKAIELDEHRGMAAQKATDLRRLLADVEANEAALRLRQDELETQLIAAPAANWEEAAGKARYLLNLFAATLSAQDPRRQTLIAAVLADALGRALANSRAIAPRSLHQVQQEVSGPIGQQSNGSRHRFPQSKPPTTRNGGPCGFGA